jgi:predicted RNA-binding Zn ribbon-like protein
VTEQPRDGRGRVLPEPSWPDDRAAPGGLELVRRFCNTTNRENGADRFADPGGLAAWLRAEGLPPLPDADLPRLVAVRERLHGLCRAHAAGLPDGDLAGLAALLAPVRFTAVAGPDGLDLAPASADGPDALLGRLALAVVDARYRGTWPRLKACAHCGWVVFDGSKNRSARWCSMSACGGRENARSYRRRRSGALR